MRKIFTEDLPKWKEGRNKGKINWEASIGLKIRFIYNEINGYLEILKSVSYTHLTLPTICSV